MIESIISYLAGIIISFIESTRYLGVFVLMTLESMLIPIPSEITMPFAGYLASIGKMSLFYLVLIGAFANLLGSLIAYYIGYFLEETLIRRYIQRYGKFLLISEHDFDLASRWFNKYGQSIVFFSRLLPIIRTFISLPAGIARMKIFKFSVLTFLGSLIWSYFLAYIGYILGKNWNIIEVYYRKFEYLIIIVLVVLIIWYIYKKLKKK